jgi:VanZ family protein
MGNPVHHTWRPWVGWGTVGAYAGFIAYMSLRAVGDSGIERAIDSVGRAYFHLPAYAGLAGLLALVLASKSGRQSVGRAFIVSTAYGWLLELAQIPAPTRSFNLRGLAFDAAGAAAGAAAAFLFLTLRQRRRRRGSGSAAAPPARCRD